MNKCPICFSDNLIQIAYLQDMPIFCNALFDAKEEALAIPKKNLNLNICSSCGHIFNIEFDQKALKYSAKYENSLHFSSTFDQYANKLADYLIDKYNLKNKTIIDIGCRRGDFLKLLNSKVDCDFFGFDKSFSPDDTYQKEFKNVKFISDFYSSKYKDIIPDLILCRHVLEHVDFPREFLIEIIEANKYKSFNVIFEVPNSLWTLRDMGIWDLIYERFSYFSPSSLYYLFKAVGFKINSLKQIYNNQFLLIEASYNKPEDNIFEFNIYEEKQKVFEYANSFKKAYYEKVKYWKDILELLNKAEKKILIWGGGSKGVSFLNLFSRYYNADYVVDLNPRKHRKFIAGVGARFVHPNELPAINPDVIIIMNPVYKEEIEAELSKMKLHPQVLVA